MASANGSAWVREWCGRPEGGECVSDALAGLLVEIGGERVAFPLDDQGRPMPRREQLARVLWARAVDGDMAAIKLLVDILSGRASDAQGAGGVTFTADHLAAAEAELAAWREEDQDGA